MGKSASPDLQTAIVLVLRGDAALTAMINGVFDEIPSDVVAPYIQVGDQMETPFNTFNRDGRQINFPIGIYSTFEGFGEAMAIQQRVMELLDYKTFMVNNFQLVMIRFTDSLFERELGDREMESSVKAIISTFEATLQET